MLFTKFTSAHNFFPVAGFYDPVCLVFVHDVSFFKHPGGATATNYGVVSSRRGSAGEIR
jgi:hypothetical protein